MKKIIAHTRASDVVQLLGGLNFMAQVALAASSRPETVYTTINSDSIKLALVEETLTDGSIVYNIELSPVCE